jgi:hypothetical protein
MNDSARRSSTIAFQPAATRSSTAASRRSTVAQSSSPHGATMTRSRRGRILTSNGRAEERRRGAALSWLRAVCKAVVSPWDFDETGSVRGAHRTTYPLTGYTSLAIRPSQTAGATGLAYRRLGAPAMDGLGALTSGEREAGHHGPASIADSALTAGARHCLSSDAALPGCVGGRRIARERDESSHQPASSVPTPRVPHDIVSERPDERLRTARSRGRDDQQRRAARHRRELVTMWLHELARTDESAPNTRGTLPGSARPIVGEGSPLSLLSSPRRSRRSGARRGRTTRPALEPGGSQSGSDVGHQ